MENKIDSKPCFMLKETEEEKIQNLFDQGAFKTTEYATYLEEVEQDPNQVALQEREQTWGPTNSH